MIELRQRPRINGSRHSARRSCVGRLPGCTSCFCSVAVGLHLGEVAAKSFQRVLLSINLAPGPNALTPKDWHGRTPSLDRVLKKERQDDTRNDEEFLIHE